MGIFTVVAVVSLMGACVASDSVPCGNDRYCPAGSHCAAVTDPDESLCVPQQQLAVCTDAPRYQPCMTDDIPMGRCYDGVCLAVACGNGRVDAADPNTAMDVGEQCDDGNQQSDDGCSADCRSLETCGNGIVDAVKRETCDDGNFIDNDGCNSKCQDERPTWTGRYEGDVLNDGYRYGGAMAYDVARNQIVLFGGIALEGEQSVSSDFNETWVWDGIGWMQIRTPLAPPGRYAHTMAYDAHRQRIVLFGGFTTAGGTSLGDTWEWDGTRWTARTSNTAPAARANHVMTYDAKRKLVVLYGGDANLGASSISARNQHSDTWLWDGTNWSEQVTTAFPTCRGGPLGLTNGRNSAAFAFDAARGVSVLFGGGCYSNQFSYLAGDDVWELDASGWAARSPTVGPVTRTGAAMAFSPVSGRVVMFGGANLPPEQWEWDGQVWAQSNATLPDVTSHALAADSERGRIVMFGGNSTTNAQTTHEWDGSTWSAPLTTTVPLYADVIGAYDTRRGRAVVVASDGALYERAATGWIQAAAVLPAIPRAIAYDAARGTIVVFGVLASDETISQTWLWDGASWSMVAGTQPPARSDAAMAFDAKRGRVVLFGGYGADWLMDTWTFDGTSWTQLSPTRSPPPRQGHVLAYDPVREVSVLVGGFSAADVFGDLWTWDGTDWTETTVTGGPGARYAATLTWQPKRGRLALVGGYASGVGVSDVWEWTGDTWKLVEVPATIFGRGGAVALQSRDGGGLILSGGHVRDPRFNVSRGLADDAELRWQGTGVGDSCTDALDLDGDGLAGCADPDCAATCAPLCPPTQFATCGTQAPRCGDGTCSAGIEDCRACPLDCGACTATCSDSYCDPGETAASCPGDC